MYCVWIFWISRQKLPAFSIPLCEKKILMEYSLERAAKYQTNTFLVFFFKWGKVFDSVTPLRHSDIK